MANYDVLKAAIQQVIKTNGNNEITGAILQSSLLSMINSLGAGYQFVGVATTSTDPGTPDHKVFYLAGVGTYNNFGDGVVVNDGEIGILTYDGAWAFSVIPVFSYALPEIRTYNKYFLGSSGQIAVSGGGASVLVYDVSNVPVNGTIIIDVNKSGNNATRLYGFGSIKEQNLNIVVGSIAGNNAAIKADVIKSSEEYKYLFVCCVVENGINVSCNSAQKLENDIESIGEDFDDFSSNLSSSIDISSYASVTPGKCLNSDGDIIDRSNYNLYTINVSDISGLKPIISKIKIQRMHYDGGFGQSTVGLYNGDTPLVVPGKVDSFDIESLSLITKIIYCSSNVIPVVSLFGIASQAVLENDIEKIQDNIEVKDYKAELYDGYNFWTAKSVGAVAKLTSTTLAFYATKEREVFVGDHYLVYGKGGSGSSRLWVVLDSLYKVIAIADAGVSYDKDNPYEIIISDSSAKYIIASFSGGSPYSLYKKEPISVGESILILTDKIDTVNNDLTDKIDTVEAQIIKPDVSNILLDGASFAYSGNSWFSTLCSMLGISGYNKAVSGSSIKNMAQKMYDGTEYTFDQMEDFDILMIMHVHNQDVADETGIESDYQNYTFPATNLSYAQAFDYVLKKYMADCYALKDNQSSKWYNYPMGKPCIVVVLTHWHDARTIYNDSVRKLRDKWKFHLVELDKNIGFSKNQVNSVTGNQDSRAYAADTETIGGVIFGWHPLRAGNGSEIIQNRIAKICYDEIIKL